MNAVRRFFESDFWGVLSTPVTLIALPVLGALIALPVMGAVLVVRIILRG